MVKKLRQKRRWSLKQIGLVTFTTVAVVLLMGMIYLKVTAYQPQSSAQQAEKTAQITDSGLYFSSQDSTTPLVIFYPGALVDPGSYSIWAKQVAAAGYPVYVARFVLDLAVLQPNQATKILDGNKRSYVIGGHSLGGVMASRYAANKADSRLKGVYFMASYPDQKGRLDRTNQAVLSITASHDGVLSWSNYRTSKKYLPAATTYLQINGGNHSGFGDYGQQKGDQPAKISNTQQQQQIAAMMINWLNHLTRKA